MVMTRLDRARARMTRYILTNGGRCVVSRKTGTLWGVVARDIPIMIEDRLSGVPPVTAQSPAPSDTQTMRTLFPWGQDIRPGDRLDCAFPYGDAPPVVTVASTGNDSLSVAVEAMVSVGEAAVETFPIVIERLDVSTGAATVVARVDGQAVAARLTNENDSGAGSYGARQRGTLIIDPAPAEAVLVGDWLVGIPWAVGAVVTMVPPIVGQRLDVEFEFTTGGA